ncbi:MAG: LLM class flavin-dependent oxidoreductase, partial [Candidatus Dormibacteraceae bacterium]
MEVPPPVGRLGVFLGSLTLLPAPEFRRELAELDEMGYDTLWIGEAHGREAFTQSALALAARHRITIATGIASIWARDPVAMANAARTLDEAWPGRFVLGIG